MPCHALLLLATAQRGTLFANGICLLTGNRHTASGPLTRAAHRGRGSLAFS